MRTVKFEKMKSVGQKYKGTKARSVIAERARSWKQIPVASLKRTMSLKRLTEPPEKKNRAPSNTAESRRGEAPCPPDKNLRHQQNFRQQT